MKYCLILTAEKQFRIHRMGRFSAKNPKGSVLAIIDGQTTASGKMIFLLEYLDSLSGEGILISGLEDLLNLADKMMPRLSP